MGAAFQWKVSVSYEKFIAGMKDKPEVWRPKSEVSGYSFGMNLKPGQTIASCKKIRNPELATIKSIHQSFSSCTLRAGCNNSNEWGDNQ